METCVDRCTSLHPIECFFLQSLFGLQSRNCTFLLVCQTEGLQAHTNPNICKNPPDDTWCKLNAKLLSANFSLTIFSLSFSSFFWASCPTDSAPTMTLTRNSFWHNASSQMNFLEDLWSITRHTWRLECLICPHVSSTKHTKHFDASWAAEWICSDMQQVHTDLLPTNMQTAAIPLLLVAFRGIVQMSVSGSRKYAVRVCHIRKFSPQLFKWNPRSDPHYYLLLNTTYYGYYYLLLNTPI